jgi:hypothetical protein
MSDEQMVTARLAYSHFLSALESLARYLQNPKGDDVGRNTSDLSVQVDEALAQLRAQRELLDGRDDAEPPVELLDILVQARDATLSVDLRTDAKKHAASAIGNMQDARMMLGQLTDR